ncbi:methyl-accepting chemotaxis protein [Catenuloplanes sp. NPDC051500]|uniref:methyl-accepting chemotaxis protein n=1 Tax=Catenuloplanes sp. NPDC051500 TaxID=3363959 RepID=UPI0037974B98
MSQYAERRTGNVFARLVADVNVRTKILASSVVVIVITVLVGMLCVQRMSTLSGQLESMKNEQVEGMSYLATMRQGIGGMFRGMLLFSLGNAISPSAEAVKETKAGDQMVDDALAEYSKLNTGSNASAERTAAIEDFTKGFTDYKALRNVNFFQEAAPAGYTLPADTLGAYGVAEKAMTDGLNTLQATESAEADDAAKAALSTYKTARNLLIAAVLIGAIVGLGVGLMVARAITTQVKTVGDALRAMAAGDLTTAAEVRGRDEIGEMAVATNEAREGLRTTIGALHESSRTLADGARRLTASTERIASSAAEAASQADVVSNAAGEVSANVTTVAAGSEEMGASIREISQNANDAAQVAAEAVGVANSTNETISKLGESSAEIGNVVKTITSIAEQTNLLALNATIEAARAGDAGKGFAVVAGEVKDLAQETAKATEDISRRVEAIQVDTQNAVEAIGEISRIIARINDYQLTIASAVEEQTATTGEMSRSVGDASGGTSDIANNINGVANAARATTESLAEAGETVADLNRVVSELESVVGRFRI